MIQRKNQWTTEKPMTDFKASQGLIDWDPEGGEKMSTAMIPAG